MPAPPHFKKTCPWTILPPPFLIFQIPPLRWKYLKEEGGGGRGPKYATYSYFLKINFNFINCLFERIKLKKQKPQCAKKQKYVDIKKQSVFFLITRNDRDHYHNENHLDL